MRNIGQPEPLRQVESNAGKDCKIESCGRPARSKGLCGRHYENLRLRGDALAGRELPIWDRLLKIGWTQTESGCLEWNGNRNEHGYGIYNHVRVHRLVVEHHTGKQLPDDVVVRHTCDNPPCGRRDHLLLGTHIDNTADMVERRRHWDHDRVMCRNGLHDLTQDGALRTSSRGENLCVECDRIRKRRFDQKKALERAQVRRG